MKMMMLYSICIWEAQLKRYVQYEDVDALFYLYMGSSIETLSSKFIVF